MARKSNNKRSIKKNNHPNRHGNSNSNDDNDDDDITDERFAAAITRPQFQKQKKGGARQHHDDTVSRKSNGDNNNDDDGDDDDDTLIGTNNQHNSKHTPSSSSSGLGESLARAIASDDRFKSALLDEDKFGVLPDRDKYGRKTKKKKNKHNKTTQKEDEAEEQNSMESSEDDEESGDDKNGSDNRRTKKKKKQHQQQDEEEEEEEDWNNDNSMEARIAYLNALSRGDISASSSSDDESSESDGEGSDEDDDGSTSSTDIRGKAGILDPSHNANNSNDDEDDSSEELVLTHEPSPYLCLLNLNWEHTRAVDVYAMIHSFCPPGTLEKVEVYPSDFGMERMEREKVMGPTGLWKKERKRESKEEEEEEESDDALSQSDVESDKSDTNDSEDDDSKDSNNHSDDDDNDDSEEEEDVLNLADATAKLYSHFPPQSTVTKNSQLRNAEEEEEGFDLEKLREYEASKLKYYFAIATFQTPAAASAVYEQVDGMEMEHSAAEIDVRVMPPDRYASTIGGRTLRDECDHLPAKYAPPEADGSAVVTALRQSRVSCSWERGDALRESKLTKWGMGKEAWEAMAEGDDIKFYLATSDNSSEEEEGDGKEAWEAMAEGDDIKFYLATSDNSSEEEEGESSDDDDDSHGDEDELKQEKAKKKGEKNKKKKGLNMRAMLGLAGSDSEEESGSDDDSGSGSDDDDDDSHGGDQKHDKQSISTASSTTSGSDEDSQNSSDDDDNDDHANNTTKQVTFTPGKRRLEDKIRSKLMQKSMEQGGVVANDAGEDPSSQGELTPFQKYLEKRKAKRKERRQAARGRRKENATTKEEKNNDDDDHYGATKDNLEVDEDGMYGMDPEFGMAKFSDEEEEDDGSEGGDATTTEKNDADGFFLGGTTSGESVNARNKGKHNINDTKKKKKKKKTPDGPAPDNMAEDTDGSGARVASTKEELELLIAGDDDEEHQKDYDMRGLAKLEKLHSKTSKQLKGKRKRQLETLTAKVSGQEFRIDTADERFAALLDGEDDRYGIDRTHSAFRETGGMKTLLQEQSERRKTRRKRKGGGSHNDSTMAGDSRRRLGGDVEDGVPSKMKKDGSGWVESSSGAMELSSLVKSLQRKVPKKKKKKTA
eukprot:CAMPEP_0183785866 /NCGR_PEP_ID=MMETSP0739-20130205/66720_1 /TAXON_ID=385413 /ORGANISM="Thalassiosira miniscula, Strain CCMP1093" /LENGTH=1111 /DNA_ID=CAMNT_0026029887 /DNA_START=344 /DNA_END=3680 /DNA_ORIENTATION=-